MLSEIGNILIVIGIALFVVGYVWSFIIAWRANKVLFILVLIIWFVGYPILVAMYWKQTKNNFFVILAAIACFALAVATPTNPNRSNISSFEQYNGYIQQIAQDWGAAKRCPSAQLLG